MTPPAVAPLEALEGDAFVAVFASLYTALRTPSTTANAAGEKSSNSSISAYKGDLPIDRYLVRLRNKFLCSDTCVLSAMIYIDRIMRCCGDGVVNSASIHDLLATSLVVSIKFHEDIYYSNAYYAKVAGLSLQHLNGLEVTFLKCIEWKLDVSPVEYRQYHGLVSAHARTLALDTIGSS
jgi:hypothetical protein